MLMLLIDQQYLLINPIENVEIMLARTVYDKRRQHYFVKELYHAIHHAWRNMGPDYRKKCWSI